MKTNTHSSFMADWVNMRQLSKIQMKIKRHTQQEAFVIVD